MVPNAAPSPMPMQAKDESTVKNFAELIDKERERLTKLTDDYHAQIADLQAKLAEVAGEMRAITAYDEAKRGKPTRAQRQATTARAPRGSKRDGLLAAIKAHPGITRGAIIDQLGVKGDKGQEQSISNALAALKKAGTITADDGKYRLAGA